MYLSNSCNVKLRRRWKEMMNREFFFSSLGDLLDDLHSIELNTYHQPSNVVVDSIRRREYSVDSFVFLFCFHTGFESRCFSSDCSVNSCWELLWPSLDDDDEDLWDLFSLSLFSSTGDSFVASGSTSSTEEFVGSVDGLLLWLLLL